MIAIGIDLADIRRFVRWKHYKNLCKLFPEAELAYCFENESKTAERLAVRFAVKEALYKALCQAIERKPLFFQLGRATILKSNGSVCVNWHALGLESKHFVIHCSVSHAQAVAAAVIVLTCHPRLRR